MTDLRTACLRERAGSADEYQNDSRAKPALEPSTGGNCITIGLPGKLILGYYFQENWTSRRPFLLLRISFPGRPGRPVFIQFVPDADSGASMSKWIFRFLSAVMVVPFFVPVENVEGVPSELRPGLGRL